MSSAFFQIKPTKRSNPEARTTLDALHKDHIQTLKEKKETSSEIDEQIRILQTEIDESTDYIKMGRMEKKLDLLKQETDKMKENNHIYDYFLETGDMLFNYYDIQDKIANTISSSPAKHSSFSIATHASTTGSILQFFETAAKPYENKPLPIATTSNKFARDEILDKYLQKISPESARSYNTAIDDKSHQCPVCKGEMVMCPNEAQLSCSKCGNIETILIDSDKPSYKDPPREISYYAYKRINHFNECLAQFQAKESTDIPAEVFEQIYAQLKKQRVVNMSSVKAAKIREILKKLDLSQYYEHIPYILNRLNGKKVLTMDRETEEKLRFIFKEIQPSFERHKPADRNNFISYHYFLYKICELLELDEFLHCFNLLKNRDKLYDQDIIWKKICNDMQWQFIKTI
jgi:hypothetical protein